MILIFRSRKSWTRWLLSNMSCLRSGTGTGNSCSNVSTRTHTNLTALINTHSKGRHAKYTHDVLWENREVVIFVSPLLPSVLEVHQFAQDAVVAEAWLTAQEPFISSSELGSSVDEVEQLIRRHEAFRKAAATWEERFSSLRRLTTVTLIIIISIVESGQHKNSFSVHYRARYHPHMSKSCVTGCVLSP